MAAFSEKNVTREIEAAVGLCKPQCDAPRSGCRTFIGMQNYDMISCRAHMQPLSTDDAKRLYAALPNAVKDSPVDVTMARSVALLAFNAGYNPQPGCAAMLPDDVGIDKMTYYMSPGGIIFINKKDAPKFIAFLYCNMSEGHRVKWFDLTGRKQYEWFECWDDNGCPFQELAPALTLGFRGTDLGQITTADMAQAAIQRSPTARGRRPEGHAIGQAAWINAANAADSAKRRLAFGAPPAP